jgi:hypothetical protein
MYYVIEHISAIYVQSHTHNVTTIDPVSLLIILILMQDS